MRITEIKPYPIWVGNRNQLVVKVETDEGIYGLGEAFDGNLHKRDLLADMLAEWVPDETQRRKVLVDNPARLYGF